MWHWLQGCSESLCLYCRWCIMNMAVSWGGSHISFLGLKGSWLGSENLFSVCLAHSQRAASEENTILLYFRLICCLAVSKTASEAPVWQLYDWQSRSLYVQRTYDWVKQREYLPRNDCTKWCDSTISIILRDSIFSIGWLCETFMSKPSVINMLAYYRHCAWQLQLLNWWVLHNDFNASLVLLHTSELYYTPIYHPDPHSLMYCVSTFRTHHFLYWLWMAVEEHFVRSRKRGSSEECWAAHTRDRVTK